jgi:tetratricopeptide (TPR) repeat protein
MPYRLSRFLALPLFALLIFTASCTTYNQLKARNELNKGVKQFTAQKYEDAAEYFTLAVELDPELLNARLYLATTHRQAWVPGIRSTENLAQADRAIKAFEEVLERDSSNVNAMANIAGIYGGNDEPDNAKLWYRKRMEVEPGNPEPYYGIGTINWKLAHDITGMNGVSAGEAEEEERLEAITLVEEGIKVLEQALELDPNYTDAMQYLNLMYRENAYLATEEEEKERWEREALKLAMKALDLRRAQEEAESEARRSMSGEVLE